MRTCRRRIFGAILASCITVQGAQAADLKWANDGDVAAMDPMTRQETVQLSFLSNIYETLVRRDRTMGMEPSLAEKWEQVSPTVWRFHLRKGVTWQDGSPFTSDDVVFSLQRILSPSSALRAPLAPVKEVRKVDDLTVDFETVAPDPIFLQEQTNLMIMSKAWSEKHNATTPAILGKDENFALRHAMGTGPFRLVSRDPDRKTVVERNPNWWDKPQHNLNRVEFNVIHSGPTRVAALLSGEMDMIYSVPPQDMKRIAATKGFHLLRTPELRTMFLGFNLRRDELPSSDVKRHNPFRDLRVRQAFALAIDEPAITSRVMMGLGRPTGMMWGPGVNGYDPAMDVPIKHDVAEAKKLLAEAGYPHGFRVGFDCTNDRYVMDEQICTAISAMLAKVGIKVDLHAQTKTKFFTKVLPPNQDSDFWMLGWTPTTYDAHNVLFTLLATNDGKRGQANVGGYSNPTLDKLIAAIGTETDQTKRNAMLHEAIAILQRDLPVIPLHQQVIVWAAKSNIHLVQWPDNWFPLRYVIVK